MSMEYLSMKIVKRLIYKHSPNARQLFCWLNAKGAGMPHMTIQLPMEAGVVIRQSGDIITVAKKPYKLKLID
jgi:hypothetical protein